VADDPEPMSDQDLQDWAAAVDAKSGVGGSGGRASERDLNAGQAVADLINSRRGRR